MTTDINSEDRLVKKRSPTICAIIPGMLMAALLGGIKVKRRQDLNSSIDDSW
jgi:hypothetical protein